LQDLGWVSSLSAGDRIDQPDLACFQVKIDFTEEGEKHWEEVGKLIFDHIRLLQQASWSDLLARWREVRQMSKIGFESSEPTGTLSLANELCRALHRESSPEHILTVLFFVLFLFYSLSLFTLCLNT
jgi:secreted Zn-dependent insulinase-like peptidase